MFRIIDLLVETWNLFWYVIEGTLSGAAYENCKCEPRDAFAVVDGSSGYRQCARCHKAGAS